jgi:hypothetical protein
LNKLRNDAKREADALRRELERAEANNKVNPNLELRLQDLQDKFNHLLQENERNQTMKNQFKLENEMLKQKIQEAERKIVDNERKINNQPDPYEIQ